MMIFILNFLLLSSIQELDCTNFRYGKFVALSETTKDWQPHINRSSDDFQIETIILNGIEMRTAYRVEWYSECHFKLRYIYSKDDLMKRVHSSNDSVDVYIEKVLNDSDIVVKTITSGAIYYDTLRKVDEFPQRTRK